MYRRVLGFGDVGFLFRPMATGGFPETESEMMSNGIAYMLVGDKYGVVITVSLFSLRRQYDGPVAFIVGDERAATIGSKIAADERLGPIELIRWDAPVGGGKGLQHCNKTRLPDFTPFDKTIFIDADTLVVGDPTDMFPTNEEVCLSQFANWYSNDRKIKRRTEPWREFAPREVARSQGCRYPAINTGTFGIARTSTEYLKRWRELSEQNPSFMCDELVAQIIFPDFPHLIFDERWNCSPIFSHDRFGPPNDVDVRIWHGHGWKFPRRPLGRRVWVPWYDAAVRANVAGVADWGPDVDGKLRGMVKDREQLSFDEFYGVAKYGPFQFQPIED